MISESVYYYTIVLYYCKEPRNIRVLVTTTITGRLVRHCESVVVIYWACLEIMWALLVQV